MVKPSFVYISIWEKAYPHFTKKWTTYIKNENITILTSRLVKHDYVLLISNPRPKGR